MEIVGKLDLENKSALRMCKGISNYHGRNSLELCGRNHTVLLASSGWRTEADAENRCAFVLCVGSKNFRTVIT